MASSKACARSFLRICTTVKSPCAENAASKRYSGPQSTPVSIFPSAALSTACRFPQNMTWPLHSLQKARFYANRRSGPPVQKSPESSAERHDEEEDNDSFLFGRFDPDDDIDENDSDFFIPNLSSTDEDDDQDS